MPLALALLLAWPGFAADKPAVDQDSVKLVEFFLKTPTRDLPPEAVPAFLSVDPKTLPAKLRTPCEAKRRELLALKKIADGRHAPSIQRPNSTEPKCDEPRKGDPQTLKVLALAGFDEIAEQEELRLKADTRCSECELQTEFTLERVSSDKAVQGKKKGKKEKIRYFLHVKDPLWVWVGGYRNGVNPFGTNFFGEGGAPHCH